MDILMTFFPESLDRGAQLQGIDDDSLALQLRLQAARLN